MSYAYENGLGVAKNALLATYWVQVAALHGDPVGAYHYGMALLHGVGLPQDQAQALFWLGQATRTGDADARQQIAILQTL